jgi:putative flavoprotein involved in K+ transport
MMTSEDRAGASPGQPERPGTVVIGGGQAGLAVGYHLAKRGQPFVILDANDRIGDTWRNRWDSLRLFTTARYSGLPGMPFPAAPSSYPTKDETADYLEAYAREFRLPVRTGVEVHGLSQSGEGFLVDCGDGSLLADNVVVATGPYHDPRIPPFATGLDERIVQLHSSEYRNPSQLRDGAVLVVGAANSGAEIALEVARHHQTWLSGRDPGQEPTRAGSVADRLFMPFMWFMATRVLTVKTPMGRKVRSLFVDIPRGIPLGRVRRQDIATAGIERVPRTVRASDGYPMLADGRVLDVSNVVWCTGFTPGLEWLDVPAPTDNGIPVHDRGVVETPPGLYLVGMLFQYSLSSALLGGVGRDAEHVAEHIASTRSRAHLSPVPTFRRRRPGSSPATSSMARGLRAHAVRRGPGTRNRPA